MATYHLNVKIGSRSGGQSAKAKSDYIEREGKYGKDAEELEHRESGNMPEWARDDPGKYWSAADEHERVNGRLFVQVEFALPRELNERERQEVASSFAERLTGPERLPYTLAIHRGGGDNPHVHLMISERGLDGHDRDTETWFKRYNAKEPEKGGAKKTSSISIKSNEWVSRTREAWGQEANRALERAGSAERIDHRSLAAQRQEAIERGQPERAAQLSRTPGVHLGSERYRARRGGQSRVVELARHIKQSNPLAAEIAGMEARLKEIYDRTRAAVDKRLQQVGRAIRTGADAVGRAGEQLAGAGQRLGRVRAEVGRAGAAVDQSTSGRPEGVRRVEQAHGRADGHLQRICQRLGREIQRNDPVYGRALAVMCPNIEQKRIEWSRDQERGHERGHGRGRDSGPSR